MGSRLQFKNGCVNLLLIFALKLVYQSQITFSSDIMLFASNQNTCQVHSFFSDSIDCHRYILICVLTDFIWKRILLGTCR